MTIPGVCQRLPEALRSSFRIEKLTSYWEMPKPKSRSKASQCSEEMFLVNPKDAEIFPDEVSIVTCQPSFMDNCTKRECIRVCPKAQA